MNGGVGPVVTVRVDKRLRRAYALGVARLRSRRWVGLAVLDLSLVALASLLEGGGTWFLWALVALVALGQFLSERRWLRSAWSLPVGHEITAEFNELDLVVRGPDAATVTAFYGWFTEVRRRGAVIVLKGARWQEPEYYPAALFSPEGEQWFRDRARPRDLTAVPLRPGQQEYAVTPDTIRRLTWASSWRKERPALLRTCLLALVVAFVYVLYDLPIAIGLVWALAVVFVSVRELVANHVRLRAELVHAYSPGPIRSGRVGELWLVDTATFQEKIASTSVQVMDRRGDLVCLRHHTYGFPREPWFPAAWVTGLVDAT